MSDRKKSEVQTNKRNRIIKIFIVILLIVGISGVLTYQLFFKKVKAEHFIPEDPTSVLLININPDSQQNLALENLALNLGDENIFKQYLQDQFFQGISVENLKIDEQDLKAWIGNNLIISRIKLSSVESRSAHVIEVKNIEKAQEILNVINDNIEKRGSVVTSEEFRGKNVIFIEGENDVAYCLYDNFLLVSEDPSGVKLMIDTKLGRNKALASDKVFKKLKRKLKADDYVVFAFIDILDTLKYISGFSDQLNFAFLDNLASSERVNVGAVFTARDDGVETNILLGGSGQSYEKKKGFKPSLSEKVPSDLALYVEGQDIQSFVERLLTSQGGELSDEDAEAKAELLKKGLNLQFGVDFDEDLFNYLSGKYAFMLFPVKDGKGFSAGLILERNSEEGLLDKMKKIEDVVIDQINKNVVKEEQDNISFIDREYKGVTYRYAKLPQEIKADIFYAVLDKELIITSSKTALTNLIDSSRVKQNALSEEKKFQKNYQVIKSDDATRLIYLDMASAFDFLDNYEFLKYTTVQDEFRRIESVGFLNKYIGEGGWAQGFISIKTRD